MSQLDSAGEHRYREQGLGTGEHRFGEYAWSGVTHIHWLKQPISGQLIILVVEQQIGLVTANQFIG